MIRRRRGRWSPAICDRRGSCGDSCDPPASRKNSGRSGTLLARQAGDHELEQRAQRRLKEARETSGRLSAEDFELSAVIDRLKAELQRLRAAPELSGIDADQLLTELRSIAGEPDATAEALQELQTERELRELKRRLEAEP